MLLLIALRFSSKNQLPHWLCCVLLVVEILSVNAVLALYGGASNPFSAVLLIPVVLAFLVLPVIPALGVLMLSIALQSAQLLLIGGHGASHHAMLSHYHGMVMSFVFTSLMIGVVIRYLRHQIAKRDKEIQLFRERQLRDEQLLAIGTAAAQLTHDVATPAQTIKLLLEEAQEQRPEPPWLTELSVQFARIEQQLTNWREVANDVRTQKRRRFELNELWQNLQSVMRTARPESTINWQGELIHEAFIEADHTLLPAITSVIVNACEASKHEGAVCIRTNLVNSHWQITVENPVSNTHAHYPSQLGQQIMPSTGEGYGVGAILSNATIERFNGNVTWQSNANTLTTIIELPLSL